MQLGMPAPSSVCYYLDKFPPEADNMKKTTKFLIFLFILAMLMMPVLSFAQPQAVPLSGSLIPCGTSLNPAIGSRASDHPCKFEDFITLINNVIKFALFYLALPIAAIMFAYAGFKLVTSGGSTEARSSAKNIFTNAAIGLVLAAGAWLIVKTLLSILSSPGAWTWIGF